MLRQRIMRYRVLHRTAYLHAEPVNLASYLLHLSPLSGPHQVVHGATIRTDPARIRRRDAPDHFGNGVTWLFLEEQHLRFEVTLEAEVTVRPAPQPDPLATPAWESLRNRLRPPAAPEARLVAEFGCSSPLAADEGVAADYAAQSFPPRAPILEASLDLAGRIYRDFTFRPGSTTISTPPGRVLQQRSGVCQDFAHLMIAALRGLGLAARYHSGYLRPRPPPGQPRLRGADASHAWVGVWCGPDAGWVEIDPTNDSLVGEDHVRLACGRDFGDVSPVRGIVLGGGKERLIVGVDLEPVDEKMPAALR